jgi:hypothetical protein
MSIHFRPARRAFSMVGMLITMVCIVVLFSLLMTSMNKAVTGEGSAKDGTVRSFEDKMYLDGIFKSMVASAGDNRNRYLTPGELGREKDITKNTTANLFSAMVMANYVPCRQLFSGNEFSGYVTEMRDYDMTLYNPQSNVFWDPSFKADLAQLSHTSFAHVPLFGERFDREWKNTMNSAFPLLGNRGPKDGRENPQSYTYGRNGKWGGHLVFGDGHVVFVESFMPEGLAFESNGKRFPDNIFFMDDEPDGGDAIITFTKGMTKDGPVVQFD